VLVASYMWAMYINVSSLIAYYSYPHNHTDKGNLLLTRRKLVATRSQAVARIANRTAKIVGVSWPRPRPLSRKLFVHLLCSAIPIQSRLPNWKCLSQVVFEILRSKRIGVTSLTFQGHATSSVTW